MKKVLVFIMVIVIICIGLLVISEKKQTIMNNKKYIMCILHHQEQGKAHPDVLETVPITDIWSQIKDENGAIESTYYIGSYVGGIIDIEAENFSDRDYPDTTIAAILCWYGGAGTEIYVTKESSSLHIFEREIHESEGLTEKPRFEAVEKVSIKITDIKNLTFEGMKKIN